MSIYPFIKTFSLLNKNAYQSINMNLASTTILNNKRKLLCGGQHASSKTFKTCTHFMDKKNSLSCNISINNPFSKGATK